MTQAGLTSAPGKGRLRLLGRSFKRSADQSALSGHARLFARPTYMQLVREEPWLRRIIPALILIFFAMIGLWRASELLEQRDALDANTRKEIQLLATLLTERVSNQYDAFERLRASSGTKTEDKNKSDAKVASTPTSKSSVSNQPSQPQLQEWLYGSFPNLDLTRHYQIFLTDANGMIVAAIPKDETDMRKTLIDLLGRAQALSTFGASAGVLEIALQDGSDALASVHHLGGGRGSITILRDVDQLFATWRGDVSRNVIIFLVMSGIILLIVYAFFSQGARAREADAMYAETTTRMDAALKRSRSGLWDWDLARGHIYWSRSMFELLGLEPRDELMGFAAINDRMHPDDGNLHEYVEALLASNESMMDRKLRLRHEDGSWVWFRIRAELTTSAHKRLHLIGVAMDVSQQVVSEETSRMADLRLHDAIDAISEAFVLWDRKSKLVLCNRRYRELNNLPETEDVTGLSYTEVMAFGQPKVVEVEDDDDIDQDGLLQDKITQRPGHMRTYKAHLDDGRWLQINERRTSDGGFVSVGTDITRLKQHEAQLVDSEQKLIATVADLRKSRQTLELQAQQLVVLTEQYAKEKDNAEAANRVKSQFLANISHELRTPLNAIIGFSEVMMQEIFGAMGSGKYRDYSSDIHSSGTYLLSLIDDILNMSRLDDGDVEFRSERFDLSQMAKDVFETHITALAEERSITLTDQLPNSLKAFADPGMIRQVLVNLMDNAVKFTPEGGEISLKAEMKAGFTTLTICDTGIGISQESIDRLGRPFEQVQNQFTKNHRGSGLGLAIARRIICLSGGTVKIRSSLGEGTRVTISLPSTGSDTSADACSSDTNSGNDA